MKVGASVWGDPLPDSAPSKSLHVSFLGLFSFSGFTKTEGEQGRKSKGTVSRIPVPKHDMSRCELIGNPRSETEIENTLNSALRRGRPPRFKQEAVRFGLYSI